MDVLNVRINLSALPSFRSTDAGVLSSNIKRLGHETAHSPPSSVEVSECVELYLHSHVCLNGSVLMKHIHILTLILFDYGPGFINGVWRIECSDDLHDCTDSLTE